MKNRYRQSGGAGFTLTELLVVVAIMALIMAIAIPAFQGYGQDANLRTAIYRLSTTLPLARQTAITTRQNVHVLFPDRHMEYTTDTIDLAYSAYAVYGARDGYIGEWRRLPTGIVFENRYLTPRCSGPAIRNIFLQDDAYPNDIPHCRFLKDVRFPENTVANTELMMALTFRPDGALDHAGHHPKAVYITQGWVDYSENGDSVVGVNFLPDASILGLEIRPETGQTRMREYNP